MQKEVPKRQIKAKEYKLLAGKMNLIGGKLKADPSKGEIRFYINRDRLLCFEWTNLDTKISSEPLVIFENEWEWKKVQTAKGRLFLLQNKHFTDDQHFFWLQYPNTEEDGINETIISNILSTGKLEISETKGGENEMMDVESTVKQDESNSRPQNSNIQQNSNQQQTQNNADFIKNFSAALRNVEKVKYPSLRKILTKTNIIKVLDDNNIQELIK
jgi:hypothetical protein